MAAVGLNAIDGGTGTTHGAYFCPLTLNPSNMTRSDSKAGYIDGLAPRDNLVILTGQQVTQINFNGSTDASGNVLASGVQFRATAGATSYSANARREVILSGGTVGSPQILQLSGIGPAAQLATAGVQSRVDLPVGYNLQDHITVDMYFNTPQNTLTWNNLSNDQALGASELAKYRADRTGMWTFVNEAVAFPNMADLMNEPSANYAAQVLTDLDATVANVTDWKSLPDNVSKGLASQYAIQQSHIDSDVGQVEMLMHLLGPDNNVGIQASLQHPWSRGTIFITSNDAFTSPAINPDYFSVGYDIDILNYGMQMARRISGVSPMNTLTITENQPGPNVLAGSDAMLDYIRQKSHTTYHPIGTCSMLPRDQGGVVDTSLLVYGTGNIRVVDSSIIPLHLSAHTMGTTYGVAEKAAEIIKKKYWEVQESSSSATGSPSTTGGGSSSTPASSGAAAGNNNLSANAGLSNAAKIGVGVGAGAGALAVLAALIAFCCIRRKRKSAPKEAGWYTSGQEYNQGKYLLHQVLCSIDGLVPKEGTGDYPMANFTPPPAPFGHQGRTPSVSTMATTDLATRDPMMANRRASSGFGFDNYNYDNAGQATPYVSLLRGKAHEILLTS
jgi:choline dehydrogenase